MASIARRGPGQFLQTRTTTVGRRQGNVEQIQRCTHRGLREGRHGRERGVRRQHARRQPGRFDARREARLVRRRRSAVEAVAHAAEVPRVEQRGPAFARARRGVRRQPPAGVVGARGATREDEGVLDGEVAALAEVGRDRVRRVAEDGDAAAVERPERPLEVVDVRPEGRLRELDERAEARAPARRRAALELGDLLGRRRPRRPRPLAARAAGLVDEPVDRVVAYASRGVVSPRRRRDTGRRRRRRAPRARRRPAGSSCSCRTRRIRRGSPRGRRAAASPCRGAPNSPRSAGSRRRRRPQSAARATAGRRRRRRRRTRARTRPRRSRRRPRPPPRGGPGGRRPAAGRARGSPRARRSARPSRGRAGARAARRPSSAPRRTAWAAARGRPRRRAP